MDTKGCYCKVSNLYQVNGLPHIPCEKKEQSHTAPERVGVNPYDDHAAQINLGGCLVFDGFGARGVLDPLVLGCLFQSSLSIAANGDRPAG